MSLKSMVRGALPDRGWQQLRKARKQGIRVGLQVLARSPRLSHIYYGVFSDAFIREHHGVAWGRLQYEDAAAQPSGGQYLIRRNVHMLEKGLIMRPRRAVFALEYIERTVEAFQERVAQVGGAEAILSEPELVWARDVLRNYFEVAGPHEVIDRARRRFESVEAGANLGHDERGEGQFSPFHRDLSEAPPVRFEDFERLAWRRRSVRWFEQRPVPRELIDRAVQVAAQSPSACNRQPFRFAFFDEPEKVRQVASLPLGTRGFNHNFPAVAAVIGRLRAYFDERDRHVIYIDGGLATMGLVYALETQGLATCCINWPDVAEREQMARRVLGLEPDERVIMLLAVGFPDPEGMVPYSSKKPLEEIRSYNQLGPGALE